MMGVPFGVQAEKKRSICDLIRQLEAAQPVTGITSQLEVVEGDWKLLFSTIAITVSVQSAQYFCRASKL